MKALEILESYSDEALDQVSADKIEEAVNLRLPRSVIIQEIISALNSLTYVAKALAPAKPPTYAFLKLLLDAEGYRVPIEGFRDLVLSSTDDLTDRAEAGESLSSEKNFKMYLNVLKVAWESEGKIDRSEAMLLEALRTELGIWTNEHLLMEHHPEIRQYWYSPGAYITTRSYLLTTGLVLTHDNHYAVADEVATQIRRVWGIDLDSNAYRRVLNAMTNQQLYETLDTIRLQVSGSKDGRINRIIDALVPPSELLQHFGIVELREFCRKTGAQVSGNKADVIANIIEFFDQGRDLLEEDEKPVEFLLPEPETRALDQGTFNKLLKNFTNDQLYDILSFSNLRTSGSKDDKVNRIVDSPWSEQSLLNRLRRVDLSNLCRKLDINVSGAKNQLIERIIEESPSVLSESAAKVEATGDAESTDAVMKISEDQSEYDQPTEMTEIPPPINLEDVTAEYAELDSDEQIILALIKDAKSLTEKDIERASRRHNLGWFLTRAHMAELLAKLTIAKKNPVRVRSVRSINIYEWVGDVRQDDAVIEMRSARNVVDALRQGVVPEKGLELLAVGQVEARKHLRELLVEAKEKKSPFKFIKGPYGSGKTFLCSWLKEHALKNEYAVSTVNIGPDQPLSDLPVFYSGVINGLRTPEKRDSSALVDILESWLLKIHKKIAQLEGLSAFQQPTKINLGDLVEAQVESELAHLADHAPGFSSALRSFYRARNAGDSAHAATAVAWLSGSRSISSQALREIGVRGYLEPNDVFPRIRTLLEVIDGARYQGLVLIVDELELVRKFPHARQRDQALETLRLLIDESGKNGFPGCLLIFTGTDAFFEDDRAGLPSYPALAERVSTPPAPDGLVSLRQPIITLEGLDRSRLQVVTNRVRDIHGAAYTWNASDRMSNDVIEKLVAGWTSFGEEDVSRKPRPILKEFINILDLCEENPNVSPAEFVRNVLLTGSDVSGDPTSQ